MKLSQYARRQGISYRTALRWWKAGHIKGYQAPTGTILIEDQTIASAKIVQRVAISARDSSREQQLTLERQAERLQDSCAAKGSQIATVVNAVASGVTQASTDVSSALARSNHDHDGRGTPKSRHPLWFPVFGDPLGTLRQRL